MGLLSIDCFGLGLKFNYIDVYFMLLNCSSVGFLKVLPGGLLAGDIGFALILKS